MEFNFRLFQWYCTCGQSAQNIRVGTTSRWELIGVWDCKACGKHMLALTSLETVIRGVPAPPENNEVNPLDLAWLKKIGVAIDE